MWLQPPHYVPQAYVCIPERWGGGFKKQQKKKHLSTWILWTCQLLETLTGPGKQGCSWRESVFEESLESSRSLAGPKLLSAPSIPGVTAQRTKTEASDRDRSPSIPPHQPRPGAAPPQPLARAGVDGEVQEEGESCQKCREEADQGATSHHFLLESESGRSLEHARHRESSQVNFRQRWKFLPLTPLLNHVETLRTEGHMITGLCNTFCWLRERGAGKKDFVSN